MVRVLELFITGSLLWFSIIASSNTTIKCHHGTDDNLTTVETESRCFYRILIDSLNRTITFRQAGVEGFWTCWLTMSNGCRSLELPGRRVYKYCCCTTNGCNSDAAIRSQVIFS